MGVEVGSKITFFVDVRFSCFLVQIISTLSNKNDYDKFQGSKLNIEKPRCELFCNIQ